MVVQQTLNSSIALARSCDASKRTAKHLAKGAHGTTAHAEKVRSGRAFDTIHCADIPTCHPKKDDCIVRITSVSSSKGPIFPTPRLTGLREKLASWDHLWPSPSKAMHVSRTLSLLGIILAELHSGTGRCNPVVRSELDHHEVRTVNTSETTSATHAAASA